ncbi:hypothetical protein VUR80DRAFT_6533 [Thermomyces stellatus]
MTFASKLALLGGLASTALAHGTVTSFTTDGKENQGFLLDYYYMEQNGETPPEHFGWYAENLDNGFVEPASFGEPDIICHKNARPATATASVAAGGVVEFQWTEWPDSHIGPVLTYVANCGGDCADVDKETLQWVKIDEAGYDAETGQWAAIALIESGNKWATTVPETLAPGNYVFRHEIIALHGAGSENGAQNYPQCFNIEITGTGTDNPEGVLGTELYTADEPGILYDPYTGDDSGYVIPGPALYGSGSTTPGEPIPPVNSTAPVPGPTGTGSVPSATETGSDLPEVTIPVEDPAEDGEAGVPSETQSTDTSAGPSSTGGAGAQPTSSPEDPSDGNDGSDESAGEGPNSGSDNGSVQPPAGGNGGSEDGNDSGNVGGFPSLPETFTLQSFIQWLQQIAGSTNARRHARDVRVL